MAKEHEKTTSSNRGSGSAVSGGSQRIGLSLEDQLEKFLLKELMPFHTLLSEKCMEKQHACPEYDNVINKLAQVNTLLTAKIREKK